MLLDCVYVVFFSFSNSVNGLVILSYILELLDVEVNIGVIWICIFLFVFNNIIIFGIK